MVSQTVVRSDLTGAGRNPDGTPVSIVRCSRRRCDTQIRRPLTVEWPDTRPLFNAPDKVLKEYETKCRAFWEDVASTPLPVGWVKVIRVTEDGPVHNVYCSGSCAALDLKRQSNA